MISAYYNEIDPYAAQWLRNLIDAGHIAPGVVDERSIIDVQSEDLEGFTQCHFFAGLGGWSYALRLARWPDSRPVWTGSPPCQPFSVAGKQLGKDDPRHLAPHWLELVSECHPAVVFGEQVEAAIKKHWLDDLQVHLEAESYACAPIVLPACSVGAPHLRQRLWFVAEKLDNTDGMRCARFTGAVGGELPGAGWTGSAGRVANTQPPGPQTRTAENVPGPGRREERREPGERGAVGADGLADADSRQRDGRAETAERNDRNREDTRRPESNCSLAGSDGSNGLADAAAIGLDQGRPGRRETGGNVPAGDIEPVEREPAAGPTNGYWGHADWLSCRDEKWRAVEPGTFPLANGVPNRVGRLRAYGNAIVPQVAAEVIKAYIAVK